MKKLVLIGGGEIGKGQTSYETENIDKFYKFEVKWII